MRALLLTSLSFLALGGCVTESTYVGSDRPVVQKDVNNVDAARTRISLALNYLSQGNSTQAKYNLERAAKFAPNLPEVHYSMAYYYQQVGEDERAREAYDKALSIEPNDPNTLNNYGVFLCDIGDYDGAVDKFMSAIEVKSYLRVAESYENLALCALEFDKFDAAEEYLNLSLKHSARRISSLINLAALKYAKSDYYHAQQVLDRYKKTGRVSSRSLLLEYLINERMGHIENAEKVALTIEQAYPTSLEARIVREQRYSASEFEQLRKQYRQHQLDELQSESASSRVVAEPKIKVVKKKSSNSGTTTPSMAASQAAKPVVVTQNTVQADDNNTGAPVQAKNTPEPTPTPSEVTQSMGEDTITKANVKDDTTNNALAESLSGSLGVDKIQSVSEQATAQVQTQTPQVQSTLAKAPEAEVTHTDVQTDEISVPYHELQKGENLFNVSAKYNIRLKTLQKWNNIDDVKHLHVGTKIYLQDPNIYHTVQEQDTIESLAAQYQISTQQFLQWNQLTANSELNVGEKVLIVDPSAY